MKKCLGGSDEPVRLGFLLWMAVERKEEALHDGIGVSLMGKIVVNGVLLLILHLEGQFWSFDSGGEADLDRFGVQVTELIRLYFVLFNNHDYSDQE